MVRKIIYVMGEGNNQDIIEGMTILQEYLSNHAYLSDGFKEAIIRIAEGIKEESYKCGQHNA